jgi:DNA repair exonuclease SbcCD ATPase subunit
MVFGFGKKKTSETPSPVQQQKKVSLEDIPQIIKDLEAPRVSNTLQGAQQLKTKIESNQKNIYGLILHLESDDLKLDDVDKNLKAIGKRGKEAVVSTIKKETRSKLTAIEKYDDVISLNNEVNQIIKRMGDVLGLHTRVMHVFARKYADKLKEEIGDLAQNRDALQRIISKQEEFRTSSNFIFDTIKKIHELESEKKQKNNRLDEVENEKNNATSHISLLEEEIDVVKSKPEYNQFVEIKKKIESLAYEKDEIRDRIGAQFSKISRPLNKYIYVSSFDKPMKRLMEELISDPYQVISTENKESIVEILHATTKSVVAGNVSVKDSDKSTELIEETIERLDEFLKLKSAYAKKISDLEYGLNVFDAKGLEEKEKELEKTRANLKNLETTREKLENEISNNHSQIDTTKLELEKTLTHLNNSKVVVKI